ncbi:hypothetical protein OIV83_005264 [Microbotryomycetes sp. JL201]|nr:hypothetical protein OIV83_005264 [Microbotryomycetes sp. JL201]
MLGPARPTVYAAARQCGSSSQRHAVLSQSCNSVSGEQRRAASSFSFGGALGSLFKRKRDTQQSNVNVEKANDGVGAVEREQPRALFDEVEKTQAAATQPRTKATFHKSSTANFKTSRRKLNDLGRLIAGRGVDEAILQLQASDKKPASRLLSMLALARNHAIAKGMSRDELVVAQSWVTKGVYLTRLDIKGRGRFGVKHHPSAKLHVLLAEGPTKEEKKKQKKRDQYRDSVRNLSRVGGVGLGHSKPIINAGVGGWRW